MLWLCNSFMVFFLCFSLLPYSWNACNNQGWAGLELGVQPCLPHGCQGPNYLNHYRVHVNRKLESKAESELEPKNSVMGCGCPKPRTNPPSPKCPHKWCVLKASLKHISRANILRCAFGYFESHMTERGLPSYMTSECSDILIKCSW